jgi:4-hydroxybutyrate CoA-transferase
VAEIDPAMPRTRGDTLLSADQVDVALDADAPPWRMSPAAAEAADHRIADHVAGLVDSGCTIQTGIGAIPDLVLARLGALTDLGIHTGIITDAVRPLIERGVVTNARKRRFAGRTVSTMAGGSQSFYDFLDQNDAIEFHPCDVTHDVALLASIERLCAINSVLEIDLHGRANAERLDGRAVSAPGGLPDFAQGAAAAPGGRSIVALRATSRDGRTSRIRPALAADAPATIGPNCIDYVVTEFGVARLTGLGSGERARALAAVAHPDFRADLVRGAAPPRCVS